jgi:very-short-patch-repair endonuclease
MSLSKKRELSGIAKAVSRGLRNRSTHYESVLWEMLRDRNLLNKKFLRQHPIFYDSNGTESFFIADFYCHEKKLIIELDGEYHKYKLTKDRDRTEILNSLGLKVIRFTNENVGMETEAVIKTILDELIK